MTCNAYIVTKVVLLHNENMEENTFNWGGKYPNTVNMF